MDCFFARIYGLKYQEKWSRVGPSMCDRFFFPFFCSSGVCETLWVGRRGTKNWSKKKKEKETRTATNSLVGYIGEAVPMPSEVRQCGVASAKSTGELVSGCPLLFP